MAKVKRKVTIDKFAEAIQEELKEFADYVDATVVTEAVHKTAEETAKAVAEAAPKKTGAYASAITSGNPNRRRKVYTETVYAESPMYRLTHLLERPHATRNGGRTRAFPHWASGADGSVPRLIANLKEALK